MHRPVPSVAAGAFVLAVLAAATPNAAAVGHARHRVAVVGIRFSGNLPDAARETIAGRVREGLVASDLDVAPSEGAVSCRDAACWTKLATALDVRYLVTGTVDERQKSYDVNLELIDGRTGRSHSASKQRCELCGLEEAGEKIALAASTLAARMSSLVKEPGRVVMRSNPARAAVTVDGKLSGLTPLDLTLAGGAHTVTVEAPGFQPVERRITVVEGVEETVELTLVKNVSGFPYRAAGWASLIGGAAAIGTGIYLITMHGSQVDCPRPDRNGNCPYLLETDWIGAAVLGAGAMAATLGGVWLYLGREESGSVGREQSSAYRFGVQGRF